MSQSIWSSINPLTTSGLMLAALLDDFKDAIMTGFAGTSRPAQLQAGGVWVDTTNQTAPNYYWAFKIYDGSVDTEIFRISILNGFGGTLTANGTFTVQEIAADALGPVLEMIKNRIDDNGQVLSGDVVSEIRLIGRTDAAADPVVGYIRFTATDDMTASAYGGTWSLCSTPDASATITEHLRLAEGVVETVAAYKPNAIRFVSQNIATAASIAQLSSEKLIAEMTGATATNIHGIAATGSSKVVHIHNRSTADITLKHLSSTASAADRIKLPNSLDSIVFPGETATLFYCTTDTYWKLLSATGAKRTSKKIENFSGLINSWVAPENVVRVRLKAYKIPTGRFCNTHHIDEYGNMFARGYNNQGQLGVGDIIPRSSPVAVLGGLRFQEWGCGNQIPSAYASSAIAVDGTAYAWGYNSNGGLGVGDRTSRSSPVAVLGGLKFVTMQLQNYLQLALTTGGNLYAWGSNNSGELGVGDLVDRSSPVAVLGGLKFAMLPDVGGKVALTRDGTAYAWGYNLRGAVGDGSNNNVRSSPVAVLGGLTFKKVKNSGETSIALTTDGTLYGWGANGGGYLGLGDTADRSSPVAVIGGLTFKDFFVDQNFMSVFAITEDGTAYAWGMNGHGNLGVGDATLRSSPVAVLGGLKFRYIRKTNTFPGSTFGITTDNDLYAWGNNGDGQLGVGDVVSRSSPVAVLGGLKWEMIFTDDTQEYEGGQIFGQTTSGKLYAWGANVFGNLGTGDVVPRSSPVAVIGGLAAVKLYKPFKETVIEVVPGATYNISLCHAQSFFGTVGIGYNVDNISIEYDS